MATAGAKQGLLGTPPGGPLIDAALAAVLPKPAPTAPDRRRQFRVIQGGRS